jgi:hypothetical protein
MTKSGWGSALLLAMGAVWAAAEAAEGPFRFSLPLWESRPDTRQEPAFALPRMRSLFGEEPGALVQGEVGGDAYNHEEVSSREPPPGSGVTGSRNPAVDNSWVGLGGEYMFWDVRGLDLFRREHATHPGDLPFVNPGSPGTTELKRLHVFKLNIELGGIVGRWEPWGHFGFCYVLDAEDRKQARNDPRPPGQATEIFSRLYSNAAYSVDTGFTYFFHPKFGMGPIFSGTRVQVQHGWKRQGDEEATRGMEVVWQTGICFTFKAEKTWLLYVNYQHTLDGPHGQSFACNLTLRF